MLEGKKQGQQPAAAVVGLVLCSTRDLSPIALWPIHLFRVLGAHPCHDGSLVKS